MKMNAAAALSYALANMGDVFGPSHYKKPKRPQIRKPNFVRNMLIRENIAVMHDKWVARYPQKGGQ